MIFSPQLIYIMMCTVFMYKGKTTTCIAMKSKDLSIMG